jgi:hypothetical protein
MRCPDCEKFVSYDDSNEPEINDENIDDDGAISIGARIVLTCADCGNELKECEFNLDGNVPDEIAELHKGEGHELELTADSSELTTRSGYFKKGLFVPAYGRYAKTFYGVDVNYSVSCSCQEESVFSGNLMDDVQASSMDELV